MSELSPPSAVPDSAPASPRADLGPVMSRTRLVAALVMSVPLLLMATAALLVPAGLAYGLVVRGIRENHPSWVLLGSVSGVVWVLMLRATARKTRRQEPRQEPGEEPRQELRTPPPP